MYFKMKKRKYQNHFRGSEKGFTLIEVIVTIVVAAILGTMLFSFLGRNITSSAQSVLRVKTTYDLGKVMENMTADYKRLVATDATPVATLKTSIGAEGSTFNNAYGSYKVINNDYVIFTCSGNNCTASAGGTSILKVTIADAGNTRAITALFAK